MRLIYFDFMETEQIFNSDTQKKKNNKLTNILIL